MDTFQTPGAFSWNELMTPDPEAAIAFYAALLGWRTQTMPMPGGDYHVVKVGDVSVGGVMAIPSEPKAGSMPPSWSSYETVADVDATAHKAIELGGKVVRGPQDIPGVGRMAVIADPQGAALNVISYSQPAA